MSRDSRNSRDDSRNHDRFDEITGREYDSHGRDHDNDSVDSGGFDAEGAWKEVMKTNFAKIDKETGKVCKREDGKVLKPVGWTPPDLKPFLKKS